MARVEITTSNTDGRQVVKVADCHGTINIWLEPADPDPADYLDEMVELLQQDYDEYEAFWDEAFWTQSDLIFGTFTSCDGRSWFAFVDEEPDYEPLTLATAEACNEPQ